MKDWLPLLLVAVVALLVRIMLVVTTQFDGLYGQDAYAYYAFAQELRGALAHGQMPPPFFWSLGYPTLLAVGTTLFGNNAAVGQAINVVMGAGCAALTFVLARQIGCGRGSSLVAGLIVAFSGQAIQSSIVLMSDIPALFWTLVSAVTLVNYHSIEDTEKSLFKRLEAKRIENLSIFSTLFPSILLNKHFSCSMCLFVFLILTLIFAALTRWLYLVLVPLFVLILLMQRPPLRWLILAALVMLPLIGIQAAHSLTSLYPTLNHPWVTGWSPQHYFQSSFDTADGHADHALVNVVFYAQPFYATPYLTPLLTPFVLLGVWWILKRRGTEYADTGNKLPSVFSVPLRFKSLAVPVLIIGWVLLPFLFLAGIPYQNIRFPLILLPPIAVLCACGIEQVKSPFKRLEKKRMENLSIFSILFPSTLLNKLFSLFLLTSLLLLARDGITYVQSFIARQMRDKAVVFWVRDHLPADTALYTHGLSPALRHYTQMEIHELYDETPQSLNILSETPVYLLINDWQIANQWAGLAPGIAVNWLREHRHFRRIGRMNDYTLYLVSP